MQKAMTLTETVAAEDSGTFRRIAWRVLPILFMSYCVAFLDRVNVGFTQLQMGEAIGKPFGVTHEPGRARVLAHANENALAGRPGTGDGIGLHVGEQLLVDPLGRASQG